MKIIAFDQSTTATGWAVLKQDTAQIVESGVIKPKGETNDRIIQTVKKCLWLVEEFQVAFIFIEGVQYQKNAKVLQILAKLAGTLEIMLIEKGYFVNVVKASEWRRRVGVKGRRRADVKKEAHKLVKEIYDIEAPEDEVEAILFARAFTDIPIKKTNIADAIKK
ncbi:MAG: crossover junction endodeoxyribonuclease RuvC [Tetragenococcus halophilus]|nr:crossover junction endodeoxyribonuclease RuvC [Tetragenococcus halophilus]